MRLVSSNPYYISPPDSPCSNPGIAFDQEQFNQDFYDKNVKILEEEINTLFEHQVRGGHQLVLAVRKDTHEIVRLAPKHWGEKNEPATLNCYFFHVTFNFPTENQRDVFALTRFSKKDEEIYPATNPPEEIIEAVSYIFDKLNRLES